MNKIKTILNPYIDVLMNRDLLVKDLIESKNGFEFSLKKDDLKIIRKSFNKKTNEENVHIKFISKKIENLYRTNGVFSPNYWNFKRQNKNLIESWDQDLKPLHNQSSLLLTNFSLLEKEDESLSIYIDDQLVPTSLNFFDLFFDVLDTGFVLDEKLIKTNYKKILEKDTKISIKKICNWNPLRSSFYKDQFYCNQLGFIKEHSHLTFFNDKSKNNDFAQLFQNFVSNYNLNYKEDIYIQKLKLDLDFIKQHHKNFIFTNSDSIDMHIKFMSDNLKTRIKEIKKVNIEYQNLLKK